MRKLPLATALAALLLSTTALAGGDRHHDKTPAADSPQAMLVKPQSSTTSGSVSVLSLIHI